jgi:hypothetical protein
LDAPAAEPEEPAHSELPPSSADKWFHCHAWRRLTYGLEDTSSEAAKEGTLAHEWMAGALDGSRDLVELDNATMADHLFMCVEWINEQTFEEKFIEHRVDFGAPFDFVDLTGTADVILAHPKHLTVADLKYGRGLVEVEDNFQLKTYLVGAVHRFGRRDRYRLVILQPRAYHDNGPIRETWVSDEELQEFEVQLEAAIAANYDPKSKPTAGAHCRHFCKALGRCPAAATKSLDLFRQASLEDEEEE